MDAETGENASMIRVIKVVVGAILLLAAKPRALPGPGTLPTHTPLFVGMVVGVVTLVGVLTFIPALALGPIVEHLQMARLE